MYGFLLVLHLVICMVLIAVVLVQSGKGGGLAGGAFGGSAQTVFGGRGATDFFTRATMVLGVAFFLTSLSLALMSSGRVGGSTGRSLIQQEAQRGAAGAPATSAPATGAPATGAPAAPSTGPSAAPPTGTPPASPAPSGGGTTP